MTVYIEKDDSSSQYNWRVQVGLGRGSIIKSRHYKKNAAMRKARRMAKQRGDTLVERMRYGQLKTVANY